MNRVAMEIQHRLHECRGCVNHTVPCPGELALTTLGPVSCLPYPFRSHLTPSWGQKLGGAATKTMLMKVSPSGKGTPGTRHSLCKGRRAERVWARLVTSEKFMAAELDPDCWGVE